MNSKRLFDAMNVYLEFKNVDDVTLMKDVYQKYGKGIKSLEWCNWSQFVLNEKDIVDMLNFMPNLEELNLSSWRLKFTVQEGTKLNLPKLKKLEISDCDSFIVDFLAKNLPVNVIETLTIKGTTIPNQALNSFVEKQTTIKSLNFTRGNFFNAEVFQCLKLSELRFILTENESPSSQRPHLKALIQSQPALKSLDTLSDCDFSFDFVNDEIFQEITKLRNLETLKINIDAVSSDAIQSITKLKSLRTFDAKTNRDISLETFKELSLLKLPLEHLVLQLWSFEIPAETYQNYGNNFNALKSLKITLGTRHQINFFIESFPNLESLSVRFGEANNTVDLATVFSKEDTLRIHENMKNLNLEFVGGKPVACETFLKLVNSFPHLEKLKIFSSFSFSAEFFNILASNLNEIKSLTINGINVEDEEEFTPEVVESFKALARKLSHCSLHLSCVRNAMGAFFMMPEDPSLPLEPMKKERSFSFAPLRLALKDYFKLKESNFSNIRHHYNLNLSIGKETKE